ncbi:MAG: glutamate--tRNA ligase [Candidatus Omnitrophota bacterium]
MVRVRFAPSPTGFLHIGGARTALFNWVFARHHQGIFVLRIEDTDRARSEQRYMQQIVDDLQWLGLNWDEGPIFQSERLEIYKKYAQGLLDKGAAYQEGAAVILRVEQKPFSFDDVIRGAIKFETGSFKDQVLMKSDGSPTYNFACCVDDYEMKISHVIRGEDHISNTPKQLAIYAAIGVTAPTFAHIPLIVAEDRSRLSKRKGAMPLSHYKEQGYLPQALFNFLILLGWSPGDDRELLTPAEIINSFSLERVVKSAAYFNSEKLEWMNAQYIQRSDITQNTDMLVTLLVEKNLTSADVDREYVRRVAALFKERLKKLSDFPEAADFFFVQEIEFNDEAKEFLRKEEKNKEIFTRLISAVEQSASFEVAAVENTCRQLIAELGIKPGVLIHPVRLALTGKKAGPGLFELMSVLGKDKVLKRLKDAVKVVG